MRRSHFRAPALTALMFAALVPACSRQASDPMADALPSTEIERIRQTFSTPPMPAHEASTGGESDPWQMSREDVAARYAAAADAGDMEAAYIAGSRLAECHRILAKDTPQAVLTEYRTLVPLELARLEGTPAFERVKQEGEERFVTRLDRYEECSALAPALVSRSVAWLEQAAADGHPGARKRYPELAMAEFESREGVIRNPLEARRRQAIARRYLEAQVHAGDRAALQAFVAAQRGQGPLYPEDRRTAEVYGYVQRLATTAGTAQFASNDDPRIAAILEANERRRVAAGGRSRVDEFQALWRGGPERDPGAFTNAQWDSIAAEGRRIFQESFAARSP